MEDFERIEELKRKRRLQRRRRRRKKMLWHVAVCSSVVVIFLSIVTVFFKTDAIEKEQGRVDKLSLRVETAPVIEEMLLPVNEYSRPGTKLKKIKGIVVHYTGNPGTTAAQNRSYFAGLAETKS